MAIEEIPGWFNFGPLYARMIQSVPENSHIVEVGAWMGKSTAFLASLVRQSGKKIAISVVDTWEGSPQEHLYEPASSSAAASLFAKFRSNMENAGVWHLLSPVQSDSVTASQRYSDGSLDFVFIDAAHDFHSVVGDIRAWWPKVRIGGWIGGHDFGTWNGVTKGVSKSFEEFEHLRDQTSWLVQKTAESILREFELPWKVAVVTPYHRPNLQAMMQCLKSVYMQTTPCIHFLVADGCTISLPDIPLYTRQVSIPGPHGDAGNAGRAIGSTLAICENVDAIAYLDSDNWYHESHIESLVALAQNTHSDVVTSTRRLVGFDGNVLGTCPHVDGEKFVDTNCMLFTKQAFGLASAWARVPKSLRYIGDRIVWHEVLRSNKRRSHTGKPTVSYRTMYREHYMMFGKPVPKGAKYLTNGPEGIELRSD